jgi:hypothetical protein
MDILQELRVTRRNERESRTLEEEEWAGFGLRKFSLSLNV